MKMQELARVTLQNEMDLILAHKRSMKLAELAGLSLPTQTTFATAVSEVSRNTIEHGKNGCLILSVSSEPREKYIVARITDEEPPSEKSEGLEFARRLVNKLNVFTSEKETSIELYCHLPASGKLDTQKVDEWKTMFRNEPAVSPYEEIKRKNEQLQEMAQRLQESESQYKTLTDSLPIIIFSLDACSTLIYANDWLRRFTGQSIAQLNATRWRQVVHSDDYHSFSQLINPDVNAATSAMRAQCRLRHKGEEEYYWHLASISPLRDEKGNLLYWIGFLVDINAQKLVEETLQNNKELQEAQSRLKENQAALEENITELNRSNFELQQFAYVASHDLQEPIRKISFYSDYFLNKYGQIIDAKDTDYLRGMFSASQRMRSLIHDLLAFSQVEKKKLDLKKVDLNSVIQGVLQNLEIAIEEKRPEISLEPLPPVRADETMMSQLFENLISNSLKYAKEEEKPRIHISGRQEARQLTIYIRDNGIGFDDKYLPKMFTLFQRLHTGEKYKGTGLGLAICQKIVVLHGGTITATGKVGQGATFIITLPL